MMGKESKLNNIENVLNFHKKKISIQKRGHVPTALREGMGMAPAATGIWTTWETDWTVGPWNVCPDGAWFPAEFWFPACIPSVSFHGWTWPNRLGPSLDTHTNLF